MLSTILAFVALLSLYYVVSALYFLTFHPLADVPGPKICAFSRIPYWLVALKGDDVQWMKSLHDRYGPVVRFGPTDLSYTASEAWNDIHGPKVTEKAQEFSVQPVNGECKHRGDSHLKRRLTTMASHRSSKYADG